MIFVFGERVHSKAESFGHKHCGVCGRSQAFSHVIEINYFCLFGFALLPIEKFANYWRCDHCQSAYINDQTEVPSQIELVREVLVYLQLGYSMLDHADLLHDICLKVTGFELLESELLALRSVVGTGEYDMMQSLKSAAPGLNLKGKQEILEAAFLLTHACCEIQYEDRLRINLIGNALGVSLEFVNAVIDRVHAHGCYGVRRILPTQSKTV